MNMDHNFKIHLVLSSCWLCCALAVLNRRDETLVDFASGKDVVEAVATKIDSSCIFQDDKELLRRIAYVETMDGLDNDTFVSFSHKGIWKMNETMFNKTLTADKKILSKIESEFQINWLNSTWQELQKPLFGGLAVRLYLLATTNNKVIPRDVKEQATFWKLYYNHNGNEQKFINDSSNLKKGCNDGLADVVFVMDSSGSIGMNNFLKMKQFLKNVISTFNVGSNENTNTRVSVVSYGNIVKPEFKLDTYHTVGQYQKAVDDIKYMNAATFTHLALKFLVEEAFKTSFGARPQSKGVPKLGIILTDGISSNPTSTMIEAARVHDANINMISIGIGTNVDNKELAAIASDPSCRHTFLLDGFTELDLIKDIVEKQTCDAPINFENISIATQLPIGGSRNCKIEVNKNGTTVKIQPLGDGVVNFYLSRTVYPNPANYEKKLQAEYYFPAVEYIPGSNDSVEVSIFCMLEGDKVVEVNLTISSQPGNNDFCQISNPCQNGGECKNTVNDVYVCVCPLPFYGRNCEYEQDYCSLNRPCENGGTCLSVNSTNGYNCLCPPNYNGVNCQTQVSQLFNCRDKNPCNRENIASGKFYFPHEIKGKFVQCSEWGQCYEMNCAPGLSWNVIAYTCT